MVLHAAFFLLLFFCGAVPALAGFESVDFPKVDKKVAMTKEKFYSLTDIIQDTPFGMPSLHYKVRLPKGWIKMTTDSADDNAELSHFGKELFQQAAKYVSPPDLDKRDVFQVRTLDLDGLISARHWFISYLQNNGLSAEGITVVSDREVDFQYTTLEKTGSFSIRGKVLLSGAKIVFVEYKVPAERAEAQRDLQIWGVTSFRLLEPDLSPAVPLETFNFIDIAKFSYPRSWILYTPSVTTIERMEASVIKLKGNELIGKIERDPDDLRLDGRVDVTVLSKGQEFSLAGEIDLLRKSLEKKKLTFGDLLEKFNDFERSKLLLSADVEVYNLASTERKTVGYEYWVAIVQSPGRYYIFRLLTLGRKDNFYVWAQNVATFRMAIKTLAPVRDAVD